MYLVRFDWLSEAMVLRYFSVLLFLLCAVNVALFFRFTAEDAFITYRYAENLLDYGALEFNRGDAINALTSPLHAVLSSALYFLFTDTVLSNKLLSLAAFSASVYLVCVRYRTVKPVSLLSISLFALAPGFYLWVFGGLETPYLLFQLTLLIVLVDKFSHSFWSKKRLSFIYGLSGLIFLTRFDSALFLIPVILFTLTQSIRLKGILTAFLVGGFLPVSWLLFSWIFYGDILPTSFYIKTPGFDVSLLLTNGFYIAFQLLLFGYLPTLLLFFVLTGKRSISIVIKQLKRYWWLYSGLTLFLLYGLTMATTHMMFSFRFFVPYLGILTLLICDLFISANQDEGKVSSEFDWKLKPCVLSLVFIVCVFQLYHSYYTHDRSVSGLSYVGEYQNLSVRDYKRFEEVLREESIAIRNHWQAHGEFEEDTLKVFTYAGGVLPYNLKEAYVFEKLVSYKPGLDFAEQAAKADYIHLLSPRHGSVADQLPLPIDEYELVSNQRLIFDGEPQNFLVYFKLPADQASP